MVLQIQRHFHKMTTVPSPSPIQTILSALESHQILHTKSGSRAEKALMQRPPSEWSEVDTFITAGRELHPAPKMNQYEIVRKVRKTLLQYLL